ncbi:TIGR02679 family protein [Rhodopseudomonas sp.]|uniref:TIGR02679 family protein n=1 Tax=Rhodopseudomonas sp. TaxID=1078 RepID=UPI003B3A6639
MTVSVDPRLGRLLGGDQFALLRKRLRQRFERAPHNLAAETFRIGNLTREEHTALASLLGRPLRYSNSLQIDVQSIDAAFQRAGVAKSLRDALEQLDGPIANLAATRLARQAEWSDVLDGCSHGDLIEFVRRPRGFGLLKRLARQKAATALQLCRRVEAVLACLPSSGITRSQLAADILGDPHALDAGQATATLVLAVRRQMAGRTEAGRGINFGSLEDGEAGSGIERDRDVWAQAGVLVNELARPVLFLNLPVRRSGHQSQTSGEPVYASLRSLLRSPPAWDVAGRRVYVCENPNVVAIAADHLGCDCAPLVCTDGMPAAAQRCLLSQLADAGAQLLYHGDFDWPGVRIGNQVIDQHGAKPWRFGADDYEAAVAQTSCSGQSLAGPAGHARWDDRLMEVMQRHGLAIAEEALATILLVDLRAGL